MFSIEYIFHSVIDEAVASSFQISVFHVFVSIHFVNVKVSGLAAPSCAFTFTGAHHTPGATAWSLKAKSEQRALLRLLPQPNVSLSHWHINYLF